MPMRLRLLAASLMLISAATGVTAIASPPADPSTGRQVFNQYCYHCHGTDAVQGERARDLRRLLKRYGDDRRDVYFRTLAEGRADKGMPSWNGVLDDRAIGNVWAFLEEVQAR